jgi:serine/threonine protein kinase
VHLFGRARGLRGEGSGPGASGPVTWKPRLTRDPLLADIDIPLTAALADRYRIERELGRGAMATVYLAQDLKHDRPLALKVLHPELARDLGPDRFLREIRLTARLQHPHILPLFDSGVSMTNAFLDRPSPPTAAPKPG